MAGFDFLAGFVAWAKRTIGTPYRYGGTDPFHGGADCSGLTQHLYRTYWGVAIPRTSQEQFTQGRMVAAPEQAGDLIFYEGPHPNHVTMYLGGGQMIEDPHTGASVRVGPVRTGIVGVRRYLPDRSAGGRAGAVTVGQGALEQLWAQAGGPPDKAQEAAAIALAESHGNPEAHLLTSREDSRGFWQINLRAHPDYARADLYDPLENARAAVAISKHGSDWTPWSTFTSGAYKRYLVDGGPPPGRPARPGGPAPPEGPGFDEQLTAFLEGSWT